MWRVTLVLGQSADNVRHVVSPPEYADLGSAVADSTDPTTQEAQMTTLIEYYKMLSMHDWHYQYSDDHRVWKDGQHARDTLRMIAAKSPTHQKLFDDYANYIYSDTPKPEAPVEINPDLQDA